MITVHGSQPTYEGLKLARFEGMSVFLGGSQPTYEGLKRIHDGRFLVADQVFPAYL